MQPWLGKKELGSVIADIEPRGGGSESVGKFLQSGVAGGVTVRGGDLVAYPSDGAGHGYLPVQGRATSHWEVDAETGGWELGLPSIGGGNGGIRLLGNQEIRHEEAEHGPAVHCDATNYGPL